MAEYADFVAVQDRLTAVMAKIGSFDDAVYDAAAEVLGLPSQRTELDQLAELFQASSAIENHYFKKTSTGFLDTISRGISMAGRYWGFTDYSAVQATAALSNNVLQHEMNEKLIEEKTGEVGSTGTFMSRGLPGGDPILVGREEQKDDLQKALSSWLPWVVGGVVLFAIFSRR
jgi:hypothetical protein